MRGQKQGQHLQRLRERAEPQQTPVQVDRAEHHGAIGQRMLPQQRGLVDVHAQAHDEGDGHAHALGLVHAPEDEQHHDEVGRPHHAPERQHVERQRHQQAGRDEGGTHGQQQLLAAGHDHRRPPLRAGAGSAAGGRSGRPVSSGCSTMTWRAPCACARGAQ